MDRQERLSSRTVLNSLPKRPPAPLEEMDKSRWEGHHSICQYLRDIYHMTEDEELRLKCREAMAMTKAMHERLKKYKGMEGK